jgi:hypothetical protein
MARLEKELPFLIINSRATKTNGSTTGVSSNATAEKEDNSDEMHTDALQDSLDSSAALLLQQQQQQQQPQQGTELGTHDGDNAMDYKNAKTKRTKCQSNQEGADSDWEFMINDESLTKNLNEFNLMSFKTQLTNSSTKATNASSTNNNLINQFSNATRIINFDKVFNYFKVLSY